MIKPLKAIANKTMVSNPIATNPQMAYKNATNFASRGEKLDLNERGTESVENGSNLTD